MMERMLSPTVLGRARQIAYEIALRLLDIDRYDALVDALPPISRSVVDLAYGYPGTALLFAALAEHEPAGPWATAAHEYLGRAFSSGAESSDGLFIGYAGLLFAMNLRGRVDARYIPFARQLAKRITEPPRTDIAAILLPAEYDLIGGLAGTMIATAAHSEANKNQVLSFFGRLAGASDPAGWYVVSPLDPNGEMYIDYGTAHGITGVLGSVCTVTGASEHHELKRQLADAIVAVKIRIPGGNNYCWPSKVGSEFRTLPKPGWCYGVPGVASVLWIAGQHLGDHALQRLALDAFENLSPQPIERLALLDHGLCHGTAGTAVLARALGRATGSRLLLELSCRLTQVLIEAYDSRAPVGYRESANGEFLDNPALLGGASGIALALLFLVGDTDASWLEAFGVSERAVSNNAAS